VTPGDAATNGARVDQADEGGRQRKIEMFREHIVDDEEIDRLQERGQFFYQRGNRFLKGWRNLPGFQSLCQLEDLWVLAVELGYKNEVRCGGQRLLFPSSGQDRYGISGFDEETGVCEKHTFHAADYRGSGIVE
jgi:hypothetical protein